MPIVREKAKGMQSKGFRSKYQDGSVEVHSYCSHLGDDKYKCRRKDA
jgi:hypothetical protein